MRIRPYHLTDYPTIYHWWLAHGESPQPQDAMPIESTWVVTNGTIPLVSASLILTNTKAFTYIENLISNPAASRPERKQAVALMVQYIEDHARRLEYKRLACLGNQDKLIARYQALGYRPVGRGLTTLVKEL